MSTPSDAFSEIVDYISEHDLEEYSDAISTVHDALNKETSIAYFIVTEYSDTNEEVVLTPGAAQADMLIDELQELYEDYLHDDEELEKVYKKPKVFQLKDTGAMHQRFITSSIRSFTIKEAE